MTTETRDGVAVDLLARPARLPRSGGAVSRSFADRAPVDGATLEELEAHVLQEIAEQCSPDPRFGSLEMYPGRSLAGEAAATRDALLELARSFFERQRLKASLTADERRLMLRTMLLARAVDDVLKDAFDRKPLKWKDYPSPQKGFRSTGQEAIVGAALRLRRPPAYAPGAGYKGDILSPLIRDLPAMLMFMPDPLNPILAQGGLEGTPFGGRDLHVGDLDWGILPPSAPLTISTQNIAGMAYAWKLRGEDRVGLTLRRRRRLEPRRMARDGELRRRAEAQPGLRDPEQPLGARHATPASRAPRAASPARRGLRHSRHHGLRQRPRRGRRRLRLGGRARAGRARPGADRARHLPAPRARPPRRRPLPRQRRGRCRRATSTTTSACVGRAADPVALYQARLIAEGVASAGDIEGMRAEVSEQVARATDTASRAAWPQPEEYRRRVYAVRRDAPRTPAAPATKRMAYDEAVRQALIEQMQDDERVFVLGEDVGGRYGGAFGVTRGLAKQFGAGRCLNMPIAESAIIGCAVGAALEGLRPVVEMQFADFLATGFNALVNNAAKQFWRSGREMPLVVRAALRRRDRHDEPPARRRPVPLAVSEMWFVRTPGWKIVAPRRPPMPRA
jgi:TPP-dependent pyruvate/acetoin dehydrogenase alpha subunit